MDSFFRKISVIDYQQIITSLILHPLGPPELLPQGRGEDHHFAEGLHLQPLWVKCESDLKPTGHFLHPRLVLLKIVKMWWKPTVKLNFDYFSMLQGLGHKKQIIYSKYLIAVVEKNVTIHPRSTSSSTSALTSAFSSWTHMTFILHTGRKPHLRARPR